MFLSAAPYFQRRFESNEWVLEHFQSAEISVSTVTNLSSVVILSKLQKNASYPRRIATSLIINVTAFLLLTLSTLTHHVPAGLYFGFLMVTICAASLSTGLIQNGLFSFVSGFSNSAEYTQAIMTGQAIAGVLPCLAQIISVLAVPPRRRDENGLQDESSKSAFAYFLTAATVSALALLAFFYLVRRHASNKELKQTAIRVSVEEQQQAHRKPVGLWHLFKKLHWLALGVFICFGVTMVFPVFTQEIVSVRPQPPSSRLFSAPVFIPLAFLIWNLGDLLGRLSTLYSRITLHYYPWSLFVSSMARLIFIPLYMLCNIKGRGAIVNSDTFYLVVVQFLFGLTNGYLGSNCMMGASEWVAPEEREAAGGFMGLMLVAGLTVGSLLSFLAAGA